MATTKKSPKKRPAKFASVRNGSVYDARFAERTDGMTRDEAQSLMRSIEFGDTVSYASKNGRVYSATAWITDRSNPSEGIKWLLARRTSSRKRSEATGVKQRALGHTPIVGWKNVVSVQKRTSVRNGRAKYGYYVVDKVTGLVHAGNEFREDAVDERKAMVEEGVPASRVAVMTAASVRSKFGQIRWGTGRP
jgi:hypothetical protein